MAKFLDRTARNGQSVRRRRSAKNNPGVILGAVLGTAHKQGRDKLTIFARPEFMISAPGWNS